MQIRKHLEDREKEGGENMEKIKEEFAKIRKEMMRDIRKTFVRWYARDIIQSTGIEESPEQRAQIESQIEIELKKMINQGERTKRR